MRVYSIKKWLNIPQYKISGIIYEDEKRIEIRVEPYKRKVFVCSGCGKVHAKGHHGETETVVEDLPVFGKRVYLHVIKRRYICPKDKRTYIEEVPWLKKWSRVTKRFAKSVSRLTAITTNQEAGWYLGINDEVVYRIDKEILEEQAKEVLEPPPAAFNISVDEVSYRKYYRYLTNVIDTDKKVVIWNAKGRKAEVLDKYYTGIGEDNCNRIKAVALDGARHYISSTKHYAVRATIVYDKFHIMQKLNKAVDSVRKDELQKARSRGDNELIELINCRQRFILFKSKSRRTETQTNYLQKLCQINEPIYKAMLLKESFQQIYSHNTVEAAEEFLKKWIQEAANSCLKIFNSLAQSFTDKMTYILNWFKMKISSAISEGFNNKIKRLKRMAYGYKDIDYFKLKIHQHCGLLNPRRFPH